RMCPACPLRATTSPFMASGRRTKGVDPRRLALLGGDDEPEPVVGDRGREARAVLDLVLQRVDRAVENPVTPRPGPSATALGSRCRRRRREPPPDRTLRH